MNTDITKLRPYSTIVVRVRDRAYDLQSKVEEIDAYIYGRHYLLDSLPVEPSKGIASEYDEHDLYYLLERRYAEQVIARLASGLFWARHSIRPERQKLLPEYADQKEA